MKLQKFSRYDGSIDDKYFNKEIHTSFRLNGKEYTLTTLGELYVDAERSTCVRGYGIDVKKPVKRLSTELREVVESIIEDANTVETEEDKCLTINNMFDISEIFNAYQNTIEVEGKGRKPVMVPERYLNVDMETCTITSGRNDRHNPTETTVSDWNEESMKYLISYVNDNHARYAIKMIYDYGWEVKVIERENQCGEVYKGFKIFDKEYIDWVDIDVKSFYQYCVRDFLSDDIKRQRFNTLIGRRCY